jgi:glycosyltransferase involved in cell wall biosynthesis
MADFYVVADYESHPSEGIQVISKTLIDGLRSAGHGVRVISPNSMPWRLVWLVLARPRRVVFTHGPGAGVVLWSMLLRLLTSARILWVATRPDLGTAPRALHGRRTAHVVIGNTPRADLMRCAREAQFVQQYIGIDPARLGSSEPDHERWPELADGSPIALHVGHLRRNRGLDLLAQAQQLVGDSARIIVLGSPTFPPDDGIVEELNAAGVIVRREYVDNLASLYKAVDLYLFPVRSEAAGAIDLPLGVLEAVACGIPVVSTPFGSLPKALRDEPGVQFAEPADYPSVVARQLGGGSPTRPAGLPTDLHADRIIAAVLASSGVVA